MSVSRRLYWTSGFPSVTTFVGSPTFGSHAGSVLQGLDAITLHGFADTRERAYAAAIYVVLPHRGMSHVLIARAKVAPAKTLSIPRFKLCAALLLARLLKRIAAEFPAVHRTVHAWSDSQIVLAWLNSESARWSVFVANRVSEIQHELPTTVWHHVPSGDNPADLATRGMTCRGLRDSAPHRCAGDPARKTNWMPCTDDRTNLGRVSTAIFVP